MVIHPSRSRYNTDSSAYMRKTVLKTVDNLLAAF